MQINQIASMIEWLDEERRRDKATVLALEERFAQQLEFLDQHAAPRQERGIRPVGHQAGGNAGRERTRNRRAIAARDGADAGEC